ncbi:hypothetical protein M5D96_002851 [Drosophila gunungcola]|uniref:Uncharacterized protein n=1 Tax=Drosophila gunungcola TaxID=103775 RepID=A0A9P9Z0P6_9MUSC|nr:hypothetical protein M5D96_002851 [Drosophila gunungcola]
MCEADVAVSLTVWPDDVTTNLGVVCVYTAKWRNALECRHHNADYGLMPFPRTCSTPPNVIQRLNKPPIDASARRRPN